ncbi:alanine/glycine:cation symporter family protein [Staphylococcus aureus]|uniref:alanine/glycine:cation symporter family protein n=1 Tax=Staphylococcus aureus TaxID=1280 RepID=UPI0023E3DFF7|nr:alanine:cation symporter family protein [Staphylococcus aureus]MDF4036912.1 alanine:cation symporter family protein [Staphylococcus aureus]MDF4039027.1 alanine:cation symporter family protein [Staphylococcus aureus]MDU0237084.1 alanine:cation symporter family protein [Staphylococcus aureus]HDP6022749.1 sodium:alanine symporter family protein [Staphylococcus aureus]
MIEKLVTFLNEVVWSKPLVYGLLITGVLFTLRMRFFQVRHFKEMIRLMFQGEKSPNGISSFQAIAMSLAGRVGTGNIVGVSTAIFIGGPGAVFWMWITAFLGASSAFIESTLGQIFKRVENNEYRGGPALFALIFKSAFGLQSAFGGIVGAMIEIGVKRGLYSNEAGQGTGPHAAAAAEVSHPSKQGLVQAFSVYIDTLFVCTATALIILISGTYNVTDGTVNANGTPHLIKDGGIYVENATGKDYSGTAMYAQAGIDKAFHGSGYQFDPTFSGVGSYFIAFALFFFAFTTILSYYYITETNVAYLTRNQNNQVSSVFINIARVIILFATFYGAVKTADVAWAFGDLGVGLMAWLNIIAIWILHKPAVNALKDYEIQKKRLGSGYNAVYQPDPNKLPNAVFWLKTYPERLKQERAKK